MQALSGLRVLDLCHLGPGMYATMILGDFGAEVIKIARPTDNIDAFKDDRVAWSLGRVLYSNHRAYNRNKQSMILNLKSPEGKEIFYRLCKTSDIIVEGFRPGITKKLRIDYESVRKINTSIIYASLSGYGQDGPYVEMPGHDLNYTAMSGVLNMIGNPQAAPVIPMNFIADLAGAALHATIGILIALEARRKTGKGQYIDISYLDSVLSLATPFIFDHMNYGVEYERGSSPFNGGYPCYNIYRTKDGKYITIGCIEPVFWINLCRFIGREDFIPDQLCEAEKKQQIFSYICDFFLNKNRDEWFELMKDKNIPVGKVYDLKELPFDQQIQHRKMLKEIKIVGERAEKVVDTGIKLSETPGGISRASPLSGEHTETILLQLGYNKSEIEELRNKGII